MDLAHRQRNPSLGSFQGKMSFRLSARAWRTPWRRRKGARDAVPQDQDRALTTHEIARHGEDEVGIGFEHPVHKLLGRLQRNSGA